MSHPLSPPGSHSGRLSRPPTPPQAGGGVGSVCSEPTHNQTTPKPHPNHAQTTPKRRSHTANTNTGDSKRKARRFASSRWAHIRPLHSSHSAPRRLFADTHTHTETHTQAWRERERIVCREDLMSSGLRYISARSAPECIPFVRSLQHIPRSAISTMSVDSRDRADHLTSPPLLYSLILTLTLTIKPFPTSSSTTSISLPRRLVVFIHPLPAYSVPPPPRAPSGGNCGSSLAPCALTPQHRSTLPPTTTPYHPSHPRRPPCASLPASCRNAGSTPQY
ncbi:hypothetical protein EDC01DRAFT_89595 [Geopyxis carbonaria]|nr:hypothetical protein EDC01DRAFT_89595 [Geopyxis carbonaria]